MSDIDYTRVMFGRHAVHVPAWLYVQDAGAGTVSFVGSSRLPGAAHPMRYGSERTHQFVLGELIVRPHLVVATDVYTGDGLTSLVQRFPDVDAMTSAGERLVDFTGGAS